MFPILTQYTPSTLFLKTEIGVWGLRFFKGFNDGQETSYDIYLEGLPLWGNPEISKSAAFLYQLHNSKNLQFSLNYRSHNFLFHEAVKCARLQFGAILKNEILVSDFFAVMQTLALFSELESYAPITFTAIFEYKLAIALYINDSELMGIVKNQIEEEIKNWDKGHFQSIFNMTVEEWKLSLYQRFSSRETFMKQVEMNAAANKKLRKLKEAHLVWRPEMAEIIRRQDEKAFQPKEKRNLFSKLRDAFLFFCSGDKRF